MGNESDSIVNSVWSPERVTRICFGCGRRGFRRYELEEMVAVNIWRGLMLIWDGWD